MSFDQRPFREAAEQQRRRSSAIAPQIESVSIRRAMQAAAEATRRGEWCAWIDTGRRFSPSQAAAQGLLLRQLLWVHCAEHESRRLSQHGGAQHASPCHVKAHAGSGSSPTRLVPRVYSAGMAGCAAAAQNRALRRDRACRRAIEACIASPPRPAWQHQAARWRSAAAPSCAAIRAWR